MDTKSVEKQALGLPAADRAKLAQKLLESLDTLSDSELEKLWLDEAARRAAQLNSGDVELVPGQEVARKARALLK
ncbi:MAG: addiction module protein [Gammaproteobacteria bacterium]|nr:addiction module protein [Gammaproteobacteria bacterium]